MRVKEVASQGILCVSSAEHLFMGIMNCTLICRQSTIRVLFAKGKFFAVLLGLIILFEIPNIQESSSLLLIMQAAPRSI